MLPNLEGPSQDGNCCCKRSTTLRKMYNVSTKINSPFQSKLCLQNQLFNTMNLSNTNFKNDDPSFLSHMRLFLYNYMAR